jgi:hypothetical protein
MLAALVESLLDGVSGCARDIVAEIASSKTDTIICDMFPPEHLADGLQEVRPR